MQYLKSTFMFNLNSSKKLPTNLKNCKLPLLNVQSNQRLNLSILTYTQCIYNPQKGPILSLIFRQINSRKKVKGGKRTSDEDMRTTVLAVVHEEIRVGSFRRRVLARVRMRRSLRHLSSSIFPNSPPL